MVQIHKRTKKMIEFDEIAFHKEQTKDVMKSGFELGLNAMFSALMIEIIEVVEPSDYLKIKRHIQKMKRPTYEKK
mgnify:CR=1 FL=1|tara:strand:- start:2608 stop:2832 length:225 start_codon:yes stop_codon:yes gene_type:complete